jgi:hypothetical protein
VQLFSAYASMNLVPSLAMRSSLGVRSHYSLVVGTQVPVADVVTQDYQDVGPLLGVALGGKQQQSGTRDNEPFRAGLFRRRFALMNVRRVRVSWIHPRTAKSWICQHSSRNRHNSEHWDENVRPRQPASFSTLLRSGLRPNRTAGKMPRSRQFAL